MAEVGQARAQVAEARSTASFPEPKPEAGFAQFLITSEASDARRRGATTEAYGAIRRKEERAKATPQMMP